MTTNYHNTFITISPDSRATHGEQPAKPQSIASLQLQLLLARPYGYTSDELLFAVHALRGAIADDQLEVERSAFFEKSKACLRASPLVKQYGWGLHHDERGKVAAIAKESPAYQDFVLRKDLKVVAGMRSSR